MKVNLGESTGLSEVGGIVPLGIAPPQNIQTFIDSLPGCDEPTKLNCKDNASLGVFQLEVSLPGDMTDSLSLLRLVQQLQHRPRLVEAATAVVHPREDVAVAVARP